MIFFAQKHRPHINSQAIIKWLIRQSELPPLYPAVLVLLLFFVLLLLDLSRKAFLITVIDIPFYSEFRPLYYKLKASLTVISRPKLVSRRNLKDIYVRGQRNVVSIKIYILESSILSCSMRTMEVVQRLLLKRWKKAS